MKRQISLLAAVALLLVVYCVPGCSPFDNNSEMSTGDSLLVGAYYYPWWNTPKWAEQPEGYIYAPSLGWYNSRDAQVISQHISWAVDYGVDFFCISWWGPRWQYKGENDAWRDRAFGDFLKVTDQRAPSDLKLCVLYETNGRLKRDEDGFHPQTVTDDGRTNEQVLLQDFDYFAANFFDRPSYLRMNDRPVVFIYDSQHFRHWDNSFTGLRREMDGRGYDIMLVGMLNFWEDPDWSKFHLHDAVTCYHMFTSDADIVRITDSEVDVADFLTKVEQRYQIWKQRVVNFIPNVIPGYDDTIRGSGQAASLPRSVEFFDNYFQAALQYLEPAQDWNVIMVTSFNEWHEGTTIEPAEEYGLDYLEALKDNSELQH